MVTVGCSCYECGKEVPYGADNHFTAYDGRILCKECSKGIDPCSDELKAILRELEEN